MVSGITYVFEVTRMKSLPVTSGHSSYSSCHTVRHTSDQGYPESGSPSPAHALRDDLTLAFLQHTTEHAYCKSSLVAL